MSEEATVVEDESAVTESKEKSIADHLADFDEHRNDDPAPEPTGIKLRDDEEIDEFKNRIETLEGENTELSERAEQAEQAATLVEEQALKNDQHDHDQLVKKIASEVGITERVAKMELKKLFEENESLITVADNRAENPDEFDAVIEGMIGDIQDKHPQRENNRHVSHAMRMARHSHDGGASYDADNYGSFAEMNDHEFNAARMRVFEDMKSGRLR